MIAEVFHDAALVESSIATTSTYGSVSIDIWNIVEEWFLIMILLSYVSISHNTSKQQIKPWLNDAINPMLCECERLLNYYTHLKCSWRFYIIIVIDGI